MKFASYELDLKSQWSIGIY